jgi:hypothetical protein
VVLTVERLGIAERDQLAEVRRVISTIGEQLPSGTAFPQWQVMLDRLVNAEALRGSMAASGFSTSLDDALAVVDSRSPDGLFDRDRVALEDYWRALNWIGLKGQDDGFHWSSESIKNLHFIICASSPGALPGRYRTNTRRDASAYLHYVSPPAEAVGQLVADLCKWLSDSESKQIDPLLVAAIAHINVIAISPFEDANWRLSRAVASLLLRRRGYLRPTYVGVDEYCGRFSQPYISAAADVRGESYRPGSSALPFFRWSLRAYSWQSQRTLARARDLAIRWTRCTELVAARNLPARVTQALFNASVGESIRNQTYRSLTSVSPPTAVSDLRVLVQAQLLTARGAGRETHYVATTDLLEELGAREDPFGAWNSPRLARNSSEYGGLRPRHRL